MGIKSLTLFSMIEYGWLYRKKTHMYIFCVSPDVLYHINSCDTTLPKGDYHNIKHLNLGAPKT